MSSLYSTIDTFEGLVLNKNNQSDASQFAKQCPCCPAQGWGFIWTVISLLFMAAGIIGGIAVF